MKKFSLQDVTYSNAESAAKILFPEMYDDFVARTFQTPGKDELESLEYYIQDNGLNSKFSFTLVGSILNENIDSNDIDLVLTGKGYVSIRDLEEALIKIRLFGLQELYCSIDLVYRSLSEAELTKIISEKKHFYTWRLNRPNQDYFIRQNNIKFKILGKMIVIERKSELEFSHQKSVRLDNDAKSLPKSRLLF